MTRYSCRHYYNADSSWPSFKFLSLQQKTNLAQFNLHNNLIWCISPCLEEIHSVAIQSKLSLHFLNSFKEIFLSFFSFTFPQIHPFAKPWSYSARWMSVYNRRKETDINLLCENGAFQFVDWLVPICSESRLDWSEAQLRLSAIFLRGLAD